MPDTSLNHLPFMPHRPSLEHLEELRFILLARQRRLATDWEESETLPWLLIKHEVTNDSGDAEIREIAITHRDGAFHSSPIERQYIQGIGFLQSLNRDKTLGEAVDSITHYLENGYEAAFHAMLNKRIEKADQGKLGEDYFTMDQVKEKLKKTIQESRDRKAAGLGKPPSLEFPPSLKEIIREKSSALNSLNRLPSSPTPDHDNPPSH
jgi:hypothetical protein